MNAWVIRWLRLQIMGKIEVLLMKGYGTFPDEEAFRNKVAALHQEVNKPFQYKGRWVITIMHSISSTIASCYHYFSPLYHAAILMTKITCWHDVVCQAERAVIIAANATRRPANQFVRTAWRPSHVQYLQRMMTVQWVIAITAMADAKQRWR